MPGLLGFLRLESGGRGALRPDIDVQKDALRTWARVRRRRLVGFVHDDAPGDDIEHRPALVEALVRVRDGSVAGLAVHRLACLADDLVRQEQLLAEIGRMGGAVYCTDANDAAELERNPGDPSRKVVRDVLRAAARDEPLLLVLRSGLHPRRAAGPQGAPAFGYRIDDGTLVPHPDEQAVLERIAELRSAGITLRAMARVLAAEGHHPKRGERWHPESLRRIIGRMVPGPART
jgi:DNA invertase Pin-like site-specific DNA recombinase